MCRLGRSSSRVQSGERRQIRLLPFRRIHLLPHLQQECQNAL
ncbi:hypothetical protein ID866_8158 [Astraeus odoratus]|nr:hypothetical protein ID866_8158 [Astraeus odoratus]